MHQNRVEQLWKINQEKRPLHRQTHRNQRVNLQKTRRNWRKKEKEKSSHPPNHPRKRKEKYPPRIHHPPSFTQLPLLRQKLNQGGTPWLTGLQQRRIHQPNSVAKDRKAQPYPEPRWNRKTVRSCLCQKTQQVQKDPPQKDHVDRRKDHPEMSRKEKVQEDAAPRIPFQVCLKRINCQRTGHQKNPNVRKASDLLGRIILTNSESLHEGKVCWNNKGDQKVFT